MQPEGADLLRYPEADSPQIGVAGLKERDFRTGRASSAFLSPHGNTVRGRLPTELSLQFRLPTVVPRFRELHLQFQLNPVSSVLIPGQTSCRMERQRAELSCNRSCLPLNRISPSRVSPRVVTKQGLPFWRPRVRRTGIRFWQTKPLSDRINWILQTWRRCGALLLRYLTAPLCGPNREIETQCYRHQRFDDSHHCYQHRQ